MRAHIVTLSDIKNARETRANDRRPLGHHAGLLLQRFFVDPKLDAGTRKESEKRSSELKAILGAAIAACQREPASEFYREAYARWQSSFTWGGIQASAQFVTVGRLIAGLGAENVLETGLRLHHTYGVPIIPGSALKGLASHYCYEVWGQRHDAAAPEENKLFRRGGSHHSLLFGTSEDGGVITFHDAWIVPESLSDGALRLDVMTPHHPKWQTDEAPPTDFDSPVPVSFLSVAGTFDVCLSWSGPAATPPDKAEAWTALAMTILREALAEWGVGGKTSSGYGRFASASSIQSAHQPSSVTSAKSVVLPRPGEMVEVKLLEERTSKGGWKAMHAASGLSGAIQNSSDVPPDKVAGDTLKLIVAIAKGRESAFRYPTPTDEARAKRAPSKRQGGPVRGGGRRK